MLLQEEFQVALPLLLLGRLPLLRDCHRRALVLISRLQHPEVAPMGACLPHLTREGPVQRFHGRDKNAEYRFDLT
jgi:hypothetical protein